MEDDIDKLKEELRANVRRYLKSIKDSLPIVAKEEDIRKVSPFSRDHEDIYLELVYARVPVSYFGNNIEALQKKLAMATYKSNFADLYKGAPPKDVVAPVE